MRASNKAIISRRNAVARRASRLGYAKHQIDDIAQESALRLVNNGNLISQTTKQAFIDSLRASGEATFTKSGRLALHIYSGEINEAGDWINFERDLEIRIRFLDAVSCFEELDQRAREIMILYIEGFTMLEISKRFELTKSRVCQIIKRLHKLLNGEIE